MNILVTGCAGFIGSNVTRLLLEAGHSVEAIDNLHQKRLRRLQQWRLENLDASPRFSFHCVDVTDTDALESVVGESHRKSPISAVINLAARAGVRDSLEQPRAYYETNTLGVLNLVNLCRDLQINKFIQASTSSVYAAELKGPIREDTPSSHPISPYAASKNAAETLLYSYRHLYGIQTTVLRYFTVYGPGGRPDMSIFRFVRGISEGRTITVYGDGNQQRDYTYVDDVARGTIGALDLCGYNTINLGNEKTVAIIDVVRMVEEQVGRKAIIDYREMHPADPFVRWADVGRARKLMDWSPSVDIEEGIRRTVNWYMECRGWAADLP